MHCCEAVWEAVNQVLERRVGACTRGLGPTHSIILHAPRRAGEQHVQIGDGDVKLNGLICPHKLKFRDALARDRLPISPAGAPEVVERPLQTNLGLGEGMRIVADAEDGTDRAGSTRSRDNGNNACQTGGTADSDSNAGRSIVRAAEKR